MIEIAGIKKSFGESHILKGIDLTIEKGQVTVLLGPSGSGKTTLLRCINALEMPDAGQITFQDEAPLRIDFAQGVDKKDILALRRKSGMVFQSFNLFPHKTALQNVMEGPVIVQKVDKEVAKQQALDLLSKVGLADKVDLYPYQLSGGQQQRVAIARAMAIKPELMLFDEPTSALDPELVKGMLDLIKSIAEEGRTMLIVTHEIQFAKEVADKIVLMEHGQIVEQGSPQQLFEFSTHPRMRAFLSVLGNV